MNIRELLNKNWIFYLFIFLLSTSFIFFHLYGIPIGIMWMHDSNYISPALETTYLKFLEYIFLNSPPTLSSWCEDVACLYYRPVALFLSKILYEFNGFDSTAFYLARAIMIGIIATIIFYFLEVTTKSKILALLGAFFFTTLPPIFSITWILGDIEIVGEFFMMCALFCFYKSIYTLPQEKFKQKILWIILFTLFSILALRSKETVKPFFGVIVILFILFYRKLYRYFLVPFILICSYLVPRAVGNTLSPYSFYAIYIKTIASPGFDYPSEVPTIFSITQHFMYTPSSMLSQLGFLFGWFVIISLILLIIIKWKEISFAPIVKRIKDASLESEYFIPAIMFPLFLITVTYFGFLLAEVEHRYFALGLVPFTFIIFISISITSTSIKNKFPQFDKPYFYLFILLAIISLGVNAYHISYDMRGGVVDFFKGPFEAAKLILATENGVMYADKDFSEVIDLKRRNGLQYTEAYFASKGQNGTFKALDNTYSISNNYYLSPFNSFNETLINNNTFYIINRRINASPVTLNELYTIKYFGAAGGCFDSSFYCLFKNKVIAPKRTFFIYEIKENT